MDEPGLRALSRERVVTTLAASPSADEPRRALGAAAAAASGLPDPDGAGGGGPGDRRIERSAGGVVVRMLAGVWHALLIRDPYGRWSLPKGHIEGGETLREAAAREVEEETGVTVDMVGRKLTTVQWTFLRSGRPVDKYCTFFLMRSRVGEPVPQRSEGIVECRWAPVSEAPEQVDYRNTRRALTLAESAIAEAGW